MELFDTDNDGTYELVRFDACFRYFGGDCGSCSPEPRVAFAFDKAANRYVPKGHIMQSFAREGLEQEISGLEDKRVQLRNGGDKSVEYDMKAAALDVFDQLVHLGDEHRAWSILNEYRHPTRADLKEIRSNLQTCPFYQYLRQSGQLR